MRSKYPGSKKRELKNKVFGAERELHASFDLLGNKMQVLLVRDDRSIRPGSII
jgi:hypothetical protein